MIQKVFEEDISITPEEIAGEIWDMSDVKLVVMLNHLAQIRKDNKMNFDQQLAFVSLNKNITDDAKELLKTVCEFICED